MYDVSKNFSINSKFSHNEWVIIGSQISHQYNEYKCCPNDLWPNTTFKIKLERIFK